MELKLAWNSLMGKIGTKVMWQVQLVRESATEGGRKRPAEEKRGEATVCAAGQEQGGERRMEGGFVPPASQRWMCIPRSSPFTEAQA